MMFVTLPRLRVRISVFALPSMLLMLWCESTYPFAVLMLSAAFHEVGHLAAIRLFSCRVRRVDILPMGALIVLPEGIPYKKELFIALAGPIFSLVGAAVCLSVWFFCENMLLLFAATANFVLFVFNLMPVKKLDGGKALYCLVSILSCRNEKTAERICSAVSLIFKLLFAALCTASVVASGINVGVLILVLSLAAQVISEENEFG